MCGFELHVEDNRLAGQLDGRRMTGKNSRDIKSSYLIQRSCPAKLSLVTYRPTTSTELNDSDNLADHHLPDPSANLSVMLVKSSSLFRQLIRGSRILQWVLSSYWPKRS